MVVRSKFAVDGERFIVGACHTPSTIGESTKPFSPATLTPSCCEDGGRTERNHSAETAQAFPPPVLEVVGNSETESCS